MIPDSIGAHHSKSFAWKGEEQVIELSRVLSSVDTWEWQSPAFLPFCWRHNDVMGPAGAASGYSLSMSQVSVREFLAQEGYWFEVIDMFQKANEHLKERFQMLHL